MLNVFWGYGILYATMLLCYCFGWSDLCTELDTGLMVFLIVSISISFLLGYLFRKKFKFVELENDTHKPKIIYILIIFYALNFIYSRNIPMLQVFLGNAYNSTAFSGIPHLNLFISSFSILYSIYLSYLYVNLKKRSILIELLIILFYFILCVQRQNIFIIILLFLNITVLSLRKKKIFTKKRIFMFGIAFIILLYLFGVLGNIRYGSKWSWNNSKMIVTLGRINENYPKIIPYEFCWSYIYLTSPLANLNYNVTYRNQEDNVGEFIREFIPEFIGNKLYEEPREPVMLMDTSLTVCTAYVRVFNHFGYTGLYAMFFTYMTICSFVLYMVHKNNNQYFIVAANALLYFVLFTFFDNTLYYPITALIAIMSALLCVKIKKKEY